eukprot:TRINITY_DN3315_c0_g1_i2.p1 TRINITY_DN3315_c0_g1~~TRINITY_DN3315_c0_g1_i2.p1  ORF type:complete len:183 (-),score=25.38 TRINITY_DN3315_c0_g1_i2:170-718(-)
MASNQAIARLKKEFIRLQKEPVPHIEAVPLESNILEWHYVIEGPSDTPYAGGYYHGKIKFPPEYPYKPPSIMMITPSGRFKPNTRLCLSMSDFHPETWNPLWSVSSILSGLLSFMLESTPTVGSVETSDYAKRDLATKSLAFNLKDVTFCKLFPHHQQTFERLQAQRQASTDTKTVKIFGCC